MSLQAKKIVRQTSSPMVFGFRIKNGKRLLLAIPPHHSLSPVLGDCVAILESHQCHSEPQAKNLTIPASYKKQILRLPPQDDIATQSLEGEDVRGRILCAS